MYVYMYVAIKEEHVMFFHQKLNAYCVQLLHLYIVYSFNDNRTPQHGNALVSRAHL